MTKPNLPSDRLLIIEGNIENGQIRGSLPYSEISKAVLQDKKIVILKSVFDQETLLPLQEKFLEWGKRTAPQVKDDKSFHRIDHDHHLSQARHITHFFNFSFEEGKIEPELKEAIFPVFDAMRRLQNEIASLNAKFTFPSNGSILRPQAIHYPAGGGNFGRHQHPYEPQRCGLILGLSKKGLDFDKGGTCFEINGQVVNTENHHDLGDIILFRYDLPHWITPIDPEKELNFDSSAGRWTMILPYY